MSSHTFKLNMEENKKRNSNLTRRSLLDAVEAVLSEEGYHALTVMNICNRAGVSKGMIKHHFGSLTNLLNAYFHENYFWMPENYTLDLTSRNSRDHLAAVLKQQFHKMLSNKGMQKFIYWQLGETDKITSGIAAVREMEANKFLDKFKVHFIGSDIDLEPLVALLMKGLYALVLQCITHKSTVFNVDITQERDQLRVSRTIDQILTLVWQAAERKDNL